MSYIDERSPLLRAVLLVAGLVIIAAGMKATATVVNLILLSILLATTLVPAETGSKRSAKDGCWLLNVGATLALTITGSTPGPIALENSVHAQISAMQSVIG